MTTLRNLTLRVGSMTSSCWFLILLILFALVSQELTKSVSASPATELEGFGEDIEVEGEDYEEELVVPPQVHLPGPQTDRGPPQGDQDFSDLPESKGEHHQSSSGRAEPQKGSQKKRTTDWDEEEFEGLPEEEIQEDVKEAPQKPPPKAARRRFSPAAPAGPRHYYVEVVCVIFLLAYAFNFWVGKKQNEKIALAWAQEFATADKVFDKNFSLLGTGSGEEGEEEALLMKEGQNVFKFYASGRRFCEGLLATMELRSRQDLVSTCIYVFSPKQDEMTVDVFMNDECMEPFVFAVCRRRHAKLMLKETKDLAKFGSVMDVSTLVKKWPADELAVIADNKEAPSELLTDRVLDQVFGERVFGRHGTHFQSLHFTDQNPFGSHAKLLRFRFSLPPPGAVGELARLMEMVPYFIDQVARFKLSAQARTKAEGARSKAAEEMFKEKEKERQEVLARKKEEKRRLEEEVRKRMTPEALRRLEEKEKARAVKKAMPRVKINRH